MKYKVTTAAFDVTGPEIVRVIMKDGDTLSTEIVDTDTNELFGACENVHDVEDMVLAFWNRLNESSKDGPHYTHNPGEKIVVVDCRPV